MDAQINDRVRATMTEMGLSSRQFADRIGLDEDKLSKSLKGVRRFSPLELANMSEVSGKSTDWYLTGVEPRRMGIAARANDTATGEITTAGASLAARFTNAHDVLVGLGRGRVPTPLPSITTTSRFVGEGQAMAEWATELIAEDVLFGDSADFLMALENAFFVDVATVNELPDGCDGLSFQDDTFRLILLSATANWTRKRFTLAHELGHILWGDASHKILTESVRPGAETDYFEKRANAFAGAFLMPEASVEATIGDHPVDEHLFHELVMKYKVSPSAMAARLVQLGQITRSTADQFKRLSTQQSAAALDRVVDSLTESTQAVIPMPPSTMLLQFIGAYVAKEVGAKPLVALTGLTSKEIRAVFNEESPAAVVAAHDNASNDEEELAFQP